MSGIRINMIVSMDEHPELFQLLAARSPKVRASVLRQLADFGIWARKGNASAMPVVHEQVAALPAFVTPAPSFAKSEASHSPVRQAAPATVAKPPTAQNDDSVLDSSVLDGVDLGGLD